MRTLVAIPVYNEAATVERVLRRVRDFADHVLVIDDGSTDGTPAILRGLADELGLDLILRPANAGYGRGMRDAFARAHERGFDWVITMDCDEQHEPEALPRFYEAIARNDADIVSGSRYLDRGAAASRPPADRRAINATLTHELNDRLGLDLTDAFCGFKAHRTNAMARLELTVNGYAFPMQLWVQAVAERLRIREIPVALIYNDPNRTFGGGLDDPSIRLNHYRCVLYKEIERLWDRLPETALRDARAKCPEAELARA